MIEKLINDVKKHLPLKILEVNCDKALFHIYGNSWGFATLSVWRISDNKKVIFGPGDVNSLELIKFLTNLEIVNVMCQNNFLKIDPVFILSNNQKLEIFSTDTYEPWTLNIEGMYFYNATPSASNFEIQKNGRS